MRSKHASLNPLRVLHRDHSKHTEEEPGWDNMPAWTNYIMILLDFHTAYINIICSSYKTVLLFTFSCCYTNVKWSSAWSELPMMFGYLYCVRYDLYGVLPFGGLWSLDKYKLNWWSSIGWENELLLGPEKQVSKLNQLSWRLNYCPKNLLTMRQISMAPRHSK